MNATMSSETSKHIPVMLDKILSIITPQHGGTFVDCTFGGGGYTSAILNFSNTKVIAFDRDKIVNSYVKVLLEKYNNRLFFYNKKFSQIDSTLEKDKLCNAIIFDLGYSMFQVKDLSRGFSFNSSGSLDMRMGINDFSASDVINKLDNKEIATILKVYGEEKNCKKIAFEIANLRKRKKIDTFDLVNIIKKSSKKKFSKINIATKSFQALRIFVNKEISELIYGLIGATKKLKPGGILLVVTFHSIEDRIVKFFFKTYSEKKSNISRYLPELEKKDLRLFNYFQKKPIRPSEKEISKNHSSRSAKLRYVIRNNNDFFFPDNFVKKFKNYLDIEQLGSKL